MARERKTLDERGREIVDSKPMALPVGFRKPPTLEEMVRMAVRSEAFAQQVSGHGFETFEEAEDFDVDDDFEVETEYEMVFDPDLNKEVTRAEKRTVDDVRREFDANLAKVKKSPAYPSRRRRSDYVEEEPDYDGREDVGEDPVPPPVKRKVGRRYKSSTRRVEEED